MFLFELNENSMNQSTMTLVSARTVTTIRILGYLQSVPQKLNANICDVRDLRSAIFIVEYSKNTL